ncbi:hypothetical protein Tco_0861960 [Tanacetum coccineum]
MIPLTPSNHMKSFRLAVFDTSRYPTTNNQLRNSSNPRKQATINNGRIWMQDTDCDELNTAKVARKANYLIMVQSSCCSPNVVNHLKTEITSDINIIPYSQYVIESQQAAVQNSNSSAQQDALILSVIEQLKNQKAQQLEPKLYDGNVIKNTSAILISGFEETLMLAEESPLKNELRKLKGKALVNNVVTKHTYDPEMLKNNVEPITPKLLNNRTSHSTYIKHTQEEAAVLRDLVEHVNANYPLDRIKPFTSASGSQPSGNTKKDKIQQTPSSTQKNKVEAHPRKVKSSLKNKDCVVASKGTANVQHSKLNANSELKCVKYG